MNIDFEVSVDQGKCILCRLCAIECPAKTSLDNLRSNQQSEICDKCFHCYAICPENAILINGLNEEQSEKTLAIQYTDLLDLLKKRRSHRKFRDKLLPQDLIDQLTDAARYSPTGGNYQELSITVLTNQGKIKELEKEITVYYDKIIHLLRIPVVRFLMKYFGDAKVKETAKDKQFFKKIKGIYSRLKNGEDQIFWDAPMVMIFHTNRLLPTAYEDCILAAYNVVLSAAALDIGTCFVSLSQQAISSSKKIKKLINIPLKNHVFQVLIAGYPSIKYRRIPPRIEKNVTII